MSTVTIPLVLIYSFLFFSYNTRWLETDSFSFNLCWDVLIFSSCLMVVSQNTNILVEYFQGFE